MTPDTSFKGQNREAFNVLVTSIGRKVPMLVSVKKALNSFSPPGVIHGCDSNGNCIGSYFVDHFTQVPDDTNLEIEFLLNYAKANAIKGIIPTRDGELSFYSRHRRELKENGIALMLCEQEALNICQDKLSFYQTLEQIDRSLAIPTTITPPSTAGRWVVKERFGSGSKSMLLNICREEALDFAATLVNPLFQPFIQGQEYSIDIYLDSSSHPLGIITRSRDLVIDGEAQISTTINHPRLERACSETAKALRLTGHVVIQAIIDRCGSIRLIECNCRFGGASTLSIAAGLDSFRWFFCEAAGRNPGRFPFKRKGRQLKQIRCPQDHVIETTSHSTRAGDA